MFPYYGHKITIEGTWRDWCDDNKKADKYWSIDNEIGGYVRPAEVKAGPSGSDVVLSWQKQGYNKSSKANGKWVVYKVDGKDYAKLGEKLVGDCSFAISKKKFECGGTYCIAFLPMVSTRQLRRAAFRRNSFWVDMLKRMTCARGVATASCITRLDSRKW